MDFLKETSNDGIMLLTRTDSSSANAEWSTPQTGVLVTLTVLDISKKEGKVSPLVAEAVAADEGADRASYANMCLSQTLHNIPAHRAG